MLETVDVGVQCITCYEKSTYPEEIEKLREYAKHLRGLRVVHINATPYGGGVAEILRSEIPLLRDLGIKADWKVITGDSEFFEITKKMHNGLQGGKEDLSEEEKKTYLEYSEHNSQLLDKEYDLYVIHDPQPLGLLKYNQGSDAKWIWRCHIDTSEPNEQIWNFLKPYLLDYDAYVFTLGNFVPEDLSHDGVVIITPAIDPESPKNIELDRGTARRVLEWIGIEIDKPFVTQVSRFDPWKDPLGVIDSYRIVKKEIPELQLALVGSMALDDPEGWKIYEKILDESKGDKGIHIFTNLTGVSNVEVNAFQRLSSVIIQKSIREGFGLVVSESLWKGTPVVAGNAGGIPIQMQNGAGGFLINSVEECAEKILLLMKNREQAKEIGLAGKERIKERFLLSRLLQDELTLYDSLLKSKNKADFSEEHEKKADGRRDPVCGMTVNPEKAVKKTVKGNTFYFCSGSCRELFNKNISRYLKT